MKYSVKFLCGCTEDVQIYGATKEHHKKIKWMEENQYCSECYKKILQGELDEFEKLEELPELIGSEKQVSWARKIRQKHIIMIEDEIKDITKKVNENISKYSEEDIKKIEELFKNKIEELNAKKEKQETSAKVWIERFNRY